MTIENNSWKHADVHKYNFQKQTKNNATNIKSKIPKFIFEYVC